MTRGYNVRVMNIADDHKPFSHRAPPLTSRLSRCSNSGRRRPDRRCLHAGVAAHEPMISWFFGQFDGQSRRTPWQAIRQQTVPASCRAGVLSGVIAVKPERGTDESAVPLSRPRLGSSLSASSRSKTALMLSPDLQGRLALLVRTQAARCCACLLYTSDAADDLLCVDLGGRRI